ncbi:MAG: hypothetical protein ACRDPA_31735 [Solirubrobacteraceae bacterium]
MHFVQLVLAAIPDPGKGIAPPGADKFLTILQWGAWITFGLCVAGVLVSAAKLAHTHSQGGYGGQQQTSLIWTLAACVLAGSASGIVGALA